MEKKKQSRRDREENREEETEKTQKKGQRRRNRSEQKEEQTGKRKRRRDRAEETESYKQHSVTSRGNILTSVCVMHVTIPSAFAQVRVTEGGGLKVRGGVVVLLATSA